MKKLLLLTTLICSGAFGMEELQEEVPTQNAENEQAGGKTMHFWFEERERLLINSYFKEIESLSYKPLPEVHSIRINMNGISDQESDWLKSYITFFEKLRQHPDIQNVRSCDFQGECESTLNGLLIYALDFKATVATKEVFFNEICSFLKEIFDNTSYYIHSKETLKLEEGSIHCTIWDTEHHKRALEEVLENLSKVSADKPTRSKRKKTKNSPY